MTLVEGIECFLVPPELEQRIAGDGVIPRVVWPNALRRRRFFQRLCEAVLRQIHDAEHAARHVIGWRMLERRPQDPLSLDRQRRIGADPCAAHQEIGQAHSRFAVARVGRHALAIQGDAPHPDPRATFESPRPRRDPARSRSRVAKRGPARSDDTQIRNRAMRCFPHKSLLHKTAERADTLTKGSRQLCEFSR